MAGRSQGADPEELKDAFKRAAEIAAVVPAAMQEAAFHRALDQILGGGDPAGGAKAPRSRGGRATTSKATKKTAAADTAQELIGGINRTDHPEIASATKVLDRALAVLRLAKRDFDIDGLTAPEIAEVLTDKFRHRTSRQAVTRALAPAHAMVDTRTRGRTTVYRIMQAGEDHLESGGDDDHASETSRATPTRRSRRKAPRPAKAATKSSAKKSPATRATRTSRRRGPKAVLGELIDEDFFSTARTIGDAQEQLRHKKGVRFSLQDLSPAFVRLLREGKLDRDRNASGQYEYRSK